PARMGKTTFSELETRPLTPELAIVTGRFHLRRDAGSGGDKSGLFTLVMRKGDSGWRIIPLLSKLAESGTRRC
ncbi:MAG TPA: nuclear transport factor 2 family protein, partial [Acidobacteriota bacterium]|nr:nuclear transport factor 2 family protein [Acidobacteriota bacterium]